ncbi:hypothetical protein [Paenibacillus glycanilyticus]|uniref:Lipoprotein n=1 Tax=Paenibacillus glycanilyticus TaxID=126569 RepID=A0ABQ6G6K5_9BACL|nr:hypothetical protein [Paenibacillus glycanilyticus]GLX66599.1 hypothetical protein MU1_09430 [Paenibacillus glycanilyticus]
MSFRMIVLLLVLVVVATGCANKEKEASKVTLDEVIQEIQSEGPELISKGQVNNDSDAFDGVKPNLFDIISPVKPDSIYIYIFDSENDAKIAATKISGKFKVKTPTSIEGYLGRNALVIYFSKAGNVDKFDVELQTAMQKL